MKTFAAIAVGIVLVEYSTTVSAQNIVCQGGVCRAMPVVVMAPRQIYVPQVTVTYQPFQYRGTAMTFRGGPLRRLFLGPYRAAHIYSPVQPTKQ